MKKSNSTNSTKTNKKPRLEDFLKDFMVLTNEGIHQDLGNSKDYLERHELEDYIEEQGLNIKAIEDNEDNLTVRDVLEIGIHWARHSTHRNWHEAMDDTAEKYGVPSMEDCDGDDEPGIKVITDVNELPKEVLEALSDALGSIISKSSKKRGGKK